MYLNDRSQHRLDEFSASLRTHGLSTQCLLWMVLNTKKRIDVPERDRIYLEMNL